LLPDIARLCVLVTEPYHRCDVIIDVRALRDVIFSTSWFKLGLLLTTPVDVFCEPFRCSQVSKPVMSLGDVASTFSHQLQRQSQLSDDDIATVIYSTLRINNQCHCSQ